MNAQQDIYNLYKDHRWLCLSAFWRLRATLVMHQEGKVGTVSLKLHVRFRRRMRKLAIFRAGIDPNGHTTTSKIGDLKSHQNLLWAFAVWGHLYVRVNGELSLMGINVFTGSANVSIAGDREPSPSGIQPNVGFRTPCIWDWVFIPFFFIFRFLLFELFYFSVTVDIQY